MSVEPSPPTSKFVTLQSETYNFWTVLFVSGGILVLYSLSRIIAIQRRVRDLESRPPVDDIIMRGMIRQQVSEMVTELETTIRTRRSAEKSKEEPVVVATPAAVPIVATPPTFTPPVHANHEKPATFLPAPVVQDVQDTPKVVVEPKNLTPKAVKRKVVKKTSEVSL